MSRIEWNLPGKRFFEAGVSQGVLYPRVGAGVPWNGLVSVTESPTGGEVEPLYYDGVKYLDVVAGEDFQATLEAYSAPAEFGVSDGQKAISPGLFVTQQPRKTFGLSYCTLIGNDLVGQEYGYKLHIVYNCTAGVAQRTYKTIDSKVDPDTRSWTIYTVPPPASTYRPTAHIVLDSTLVDPYAMQQIEGMLYGHDGADPYLPTIAQIVSALDSKITALITAVI